MHPDTERRVKRYYQQKWLIDAILSLMGPMPFTAGSLRRSFEAIGWDILSEANLIETRIKKFSDIKREILKVARNREGAAKQAEIDGHTVSARENYFAASLMYGTARWPIWEDNQEIVDFTDRMVQLYEKYIEHANCQIERVGIPFEGKELFGILHVPANVNGKAPCVVTIPGMDTFKEQMVRLHGDKFLERGIAVLALDGPGQGETRVKGLAVNSDNYDRAGKEIMDYLRTRHEIDSEKITMRGMSFGSYWCPRVIAYDGRYKAGVVYMTGHEPGRRTLFESALPVYKQRHMWMTGIYDEDEFDETYARKLTLEGIGEKIKCPFLILAGEDDENSPIEYTHQFYSSLAGPKRLIVYEGMGHAITDPQYMNVVADYVLDVVNGQSIETEQLYVQRSGRTLRT